MLLLLLFAFVFPKPSTSSNFDLASFFRPLELVTDRLEIENEFIQQIPGFECDSVFDATYVWDIQCPPSLSECFRQKSFLQSTVPPSSQLVILTPHNETKTTSLLNPKICYDLLENKKHFPANCNCDNICHNQFQVFSNILLSFPTRRNKKCQRVYYISGSQNMKDCECGNYCFRGYGHTKKKEKSEEYGIKCSFLGDPWNIRNCELDVQIGNSAKRDDDLICDIHTLISEEMIFLDGDAESGK